jgi:glycosyltransferase involved in cell wall biosynthesis
VVPSFNQASFLGDCLECLARYPADVCEILVLDGGSSDGSVEVIRKYEHRIAYWQSTSDDGQSAALLKGFRLARGSIFGWLNSDDRLIDGALHTVIDYFARHPSIQWAYGDHDFIDVEGCRLSSRYVASVDYQELYWGDRYLPQEAVFFLRDMYFKVGEINPDLPLTMDFDLWLRMARLAPPGKIPATLGEFRRHPGQKTSDIDAYHAAARRNRSAHPAPPAPSVLRRLSWALKHATYRYTRTTVEHGILSVVTEVNARRRGVRSWPPGHADEPSRRMLLWEEPHPHERTERDP